MIEPDLSPTDLQPYRIETVYVLIGTGPDGTEGVPAFMDGITLMPCFFTDSTKVELYKKNFKRMLAGTPGADKMTLTLRTFTLAKEEVLT